MYCDCINELDLLFIPPITRIIDEYAHDPLALMSDCTSLLLNIRACGGRIWTSTHGEYIDKECAGIYPYSAINISPYLVEKGNGDWSTLAFIGVQFIFKLSPKEGFSAKVNVLINTEDNQLSFLREFFLPEKRIEMMWSAVWSHFGRRKGGQSAIRYSNEYYQVRQLDHRIGAFAGAWDAAYRALGEMMRLAQHLPLPLIYDSVQFT